MILLVSNKKGERYNVPVKDIIYLESYNHSIDVHTMEECYKSNERLYQLYSLLDPQTSADYLWMDFLPCMKCMFPAYYTYKNDKLCLNEKLDISLNNLDDYYFTDIYIEIFEDNRFIKRVDVDYSKNTSEYTVPINETISMNSNNSTVNIYVIGKDNIGLTHKYIVWSANESGYTTFDINEEIFDNNGNQLTHNLD